MNTEENRNYKSLESTNHPVKSADDSQDSNDVRNRKQRGSDPENFVIVDADYLAGGKPRRFKSSNGDIYLPSHIYEPKEGPSPLANHGSDSKFEQDIASMDRFVDRLAKEGLAAQVLSSRPELTDRVMTLLHEP